MRRPWMIAVAVIAAAGALWLALVGFDSGVPVETAEVVAGPIGQYVDEQAITRLPETYLITMPIAGRIEPIRLIEGAPVKQGQVVARIVERDLELAVQEARAAVERLDAAIEENAYNRVEETAHEQMQQFVESTKATVEAAKARMEAGQARHDYAERNLSRMQRLVEQNAASQDQVDRAMVDKVEAAVNFRQDQLVYAASLAIKAATDLMPVMVRQYIDRKSLTGAVLYKQKAEAEARLQQVLQDRDRGTMTSPVDGVVIDRLVTNERYLAAGTTLLEIGQLEHLETEADVLSLDVVDVQEGDAVEIYGPAIGLPRARGTVARIFPAGFTKISSLGVEQQRVKVIVTFNADDLRRLRRERHLGVGYRVRVRIATEQKTSTLVIPRSALFRAADGQWQVYRVEAGRALIRPVEVGIINDEHVEIVAGLEAGDRVIPAPDSNLADGQRVATITRRDGRGQ